MRIDAFNRVSQLYQSNSTKKLTSTSKSSNPDSVEISRLGRDIQTAKAAVEKTPSVRTEKVADIKARMDAGTYKTDMDALADKLLDGYLL